MASGYTPMSTMYDDANHHRFSIPYVERREFPASIDRKQLSSPKPLTSIMSGPSMVKNQLLHTNAPGLFTRLERSRTTLAFQQNYNSKTTKPMLRFAAT